MHFILFFLPYLHIYLYLQKLFHRPGVGFNSGVVYLTADEVTVALALNDAVAQYPSVSFGSYPKVFHRLVFTLCKYC